jgi:type I restriction enzyme, S subunit
MSKKVPQIRFNGFTDPWEERKLGEVATLSSSKRIHLSDYVTEGIPFYRGSEISTGGITGNQELFISQEKFDEIKEKYGVPSEGDILVTAVGTLGNLWKVDSRRFYYKDGNLIQISKMQVNSDYLLTYFTGGIGKKRLLDSAAGSNQKALTMVKMREITVDFPSEDEQKKIGAFFKSLDDTIALPQRKLDLLKEQKKGYLQKMFPKNGAKVPELRFAGFADDWVQRNLGEWSDVRDGTHASPKYIEQGHPMVTSKNLTDSGLDMSDVSYLTDEDFNEINQRSKVDIGDILFGMIGTIGKPVIVDRDDFAIKNVALIKEKTSPEIINTWLIQYLKSPSFERFIQKENAGGTQKFIALGLIRDMKLMTPSVQEQARIGELLNHLDNLIAANQRKLDLLKEQKKGFLQNMFV